MAFKQLQAIAVGLSAIAATTLAAQTPGSAAENARTSRPSHPEEVAWVDEGERGFVYRRFPGGQRLYTFAPDSPGRSRCMDGCAAAWPPVPAPADARNVGRWTVVTRSDGLRQWAFNGKPVYTRFHDSPDQPSGNGHRGVWHLLPYMSEREQPRGG